VILVLVFEGGIGISSRESICLICKLFSGRDNIFGTVKRKWGFGFTDLRGLDKINGEFALIMTVYNLKRTINILGTKDLLQKIKTWKPEYKKLSLALKPSVFGLSGDLLSYLSFFMGSLNLNFLLNRIQVPGPVSPQYAPETPFFQKYRSFFTA
jgi:hypothetical protein